MKKGFKILPIFLLSSMLLLMGCECYQAPDYGSNYDPCQGQNYCPDGSCMWGGECEDDDEGVAVEPPSISPTISDVFLDEDSSGVTISLDNYENEGDADLAGWAFIGADPNFITATLRNDNLNIHPTYNFHLDNNFVLDKDHNYFHNLVLDNIHTPLTITY